MTISTSTRRIVVEPILNPDGSILISNAIFRETVQREFIGIDVVFEPEQLPVTISPLGASSAIIIDNENNKRIIVHHFNHLPVFGYFKNLLDVVPQKDKQHLMWSFVGSADQATKMRFIAENKRFTFMVMFISNLGANIGTWDEIDLLMIDNLTNQARQMSISNCWRDGRFCFGSDAVKALAENCNNLQYDKVREQLHATEFNDHLLDQTLPCMPLFWKFTALETWAPDITPSQIPPLSENPYRSRATLAAQQLTPGT